MTVDVGPIKRNELIQNKTAKVCNLLSKGNKTGANLTPKISILFFTGRLYPPQMSMRVKVSKIRLGHKHFFLLHSLWYSKLLGISEHTRLFNSIYCFDLQLSAYSKAKQLNLRNTLLIRSQD